VYSQKPLTHLLDQASNLVRMKKSTIVIKSFLDGFTGGNIFGNQAFLDGFTMAGLFTKLRRPGAPTQLFADPDPGRMPGGAKVLVEDATNLQESQFKDLFDPFLSQSSDDMRGRIADSENRKNRS
jgi:hypothetical protein